MQGGVECLVAGRRELDGIRLWIRRPGVVLGATPTLFVTSGEQVHRAVFVLVGISEPDRRQDLQMWGWLGFVERATTRWVARGGIDRAALVEMLLDAAAPLLAEDQ